MAAHGVWAPGTLRRTPGRNAVVIWISASGVEERENMCDGKAAAGLLTAFVRGVQVQPGDEFEVDLPELGAPLKNPLATVASGFGFGGVRQM